jgi:hypothetical protein
MTTTETLIKYLTDMHAGEVQLLHTLNGQVKNSDLAHYGEASAILERLQLRTENAISTLAIEIEELRGSPRGSFKDGVTAAAGAVLGAIAHTRSHHVTKMLRDDYTTLSLLSISYELLHATGNALQSPQVASIALSGLKEVSGFIMEISQAIIPVAVEELSTTNEIDPAVIELTQKNIIEAWKSQ